MGRMVVSSLHKQTEYQVFWMRFGQKYPGGWFEEELKSWSKGLIIVLGLFFYLTRLDIQGIRKSDFILLRLVLVIGFIVTIPLDLILAVMLIAVLLAVGALYLICLIILLIISMLLGCCLFY